MKVSWLSGGASSFVAAYLAKPDRAIYINVANQHPDTLRFIADCAARLECPVEIIGDFRYRQSVDEVIAKRRYINGPAGAACTTELKKRVRQEWERKNATTDMVYVWGFDADERKRAERTRTASEFGVEFPLIERNLTKKDVHAICDELGLKRPAMCDLASSETVELKKGEVKVVPLGVSMKLPYGVFGIVVPRSSTCLKHGIMMANSIGIIENKYCGDGDVWGFVAYAIRDTVIERGTRIAQFMPSPLVPDWNKIIFEEVESMGCADRGGYGSTGERSVGASIAEGHTFCDANGLELHVGDYVIDELGECFCVMGLNREDGATAAYADLGNSRTSLECAPCKSLELDERPHDCDGVPIEVGNVLYQTTFEGKPIGDPMEVKRYTGNALFVKGLALPINAWSCTHREPDSWEKLSEDAMKTACDYAEAPLDESGLTICDGCRFHKRKDCYREMTLDVLARAKRLAGIEEQEGE